MKIFADDKRSAPRYDVVVLAGDATITQLIVCSGNHDLDSRSESGEKVARWIADVRPFNVVSDGDTIAIEDTLFTVCPWWDGPLVRETLIAQLDSDAARRAGKRWIWIHHAPPINSPTSWSGSRSMGDQDVERWIHRYAPDIVVAGHIHQSPFVKNGSWADQIGSTWIFNAGHQFEAPPAHIALETKLGEAVWVSAMDVQRIRLNAPLKRPILSAGAVPEWFAKGRSI